MTDVSRRDYYPAKTLALFHGSDEFIKGVMGPVGSGKSSACCMDIMRRALRQPPGHDGIRRSRWAAIRETYPELRTTTIKTWLHWFPGTRMTYQAPITGTFRDGDVELEILFISIPHPDDVSKLLSLELTGAWFNEAREISKEALDMVTGRVGRYPSKDSLPLGYWSGIIMDTNPPDTEHWWYRAAEITRPDGWQFFKQPGALIRNTEGRYVANPLAENVDHQPLGYSYWTRQIAGKDRDWINVYILGQYGSVFTGKPVYQDFWGDERHVAGRPLGIHRKLPLYLGWDWGLTPACVVCQVNPNGQLRVLREYVCEDGAIRQFAQDTVIPALNNEFPGMDRISTGDPAGIQRSQVDEVTPIGELGRLGIPTDPAATNDFNIRRQAVIGFLTRMVGDEPGFLIDPSCTMLRRAMGGGYQFSRIQVSGEDRYRDVPVKNRFSHIAEALQYACLRLDPSIVSRDRPLVAYPDNHGWGGI